MRYTAEQLKRKYKDKYIEVYPTYNYQEKKWEYEVRSVSRTIRENYNLPEDTVVK